MKAAPPIAFHPEKGVAVLMENRWNLGLEYQIMKELGHGSYGRVYEGIETKTGKKIAIKKFIRALAHPQLAMYCSREVEILSKLCNDNVVKKFKILRSTQSVYIVMEYMPMDLKKLIRSPIFLDHLQIKHIMYEILIGLNYLHSSKIVHRDIKPGNVLVSSDCKVKICDFGLARSVCGLKISKFDFDEIYRREFAESNDTNLVMGVASPEAEEDIIEDLDEHASANNSISIKGYFDVGVGKKKREESLSPGGKKSIHMLKKLPLIQTESCDSVPEKKPGHEEEKLSVKVRRDMFIRSIKPDPNMERELTSHIASRWYRSPEVILLEKVYNSGVDIWGAGCIFAELLQMIEKNRKTNRDRTPLFPGTSCFPLSPLLKPGSDGEVEHFQKGDQLITICNVLGNPSEEDLNFISDEGAKQYVKLMPKSSGISFEKNFPDCNAEEIDLLRRMLTYNPFMRITAKEALRHPYFKEIRVKELEKEGPPIILETEDNDSLSIQSLISYCDNDKALD